MLFLKQYQMNRSSFLESNISQFIIRYAGDDRDRIKKSKQCVSSDLEIKHHKKKVRRLDCSEISIGEKVTRKQQPQSVRTNVDERKQQRQFSKVPIQYLDERDSGNSADKVRGRVVYRGYAPKNTYFYFKTIKQLKIQSSFVSRQERDYRGEDVYFNSKFQSGNLNAAVRVGSRQYWLYMRQDTNTRGLKQWYYFEMRTRKSIKLKIRIYKFTKRFSLYKLGMKPFVRTVASEWRQDGNSVNYEYDPDQKCYFLQFQYSFEAGVETYFATLPPYTCSNLNDYLESLQTEEMVNVKKIGMSLSGLDIMAISIISKHKEIDKQENHFKPNDSLANHLYSHSSQKEAIIVLSRTHPGETVSNFALQTFVKRVLQLAPLTDKYNFYIIPMINPDGVFLGNHRTGVLGQDLNRNFHSIDLQFFPEIETVQNYIIHIQKKHKVAFLFDLHGHSAKKNIFAYGEQAQIGSSRYLMNRIIPKILSNSIDSFKYDHCVFKASKEKKKTARVYFSNKNGLTAITFQQSYGLLDVGHIGIIHWKNFGIALANSLLQFLSFSANNLFPEMTDYLKDEMERDEQMSKKIKAKKEKQLQQFKAKLLTTKTEINEQQIAKITVHQLIRKIKGIEQDQKQIKTTPQQYDQISEEEELSSGDQNLEMTNYELELIKKDIVRVGVVNREYYKRQLYSMADKKVELGQEYVAQNTYRLHHKHSSMVQRIFKFKSRQKTKQLQMPLSPHYRDKGQSIELPYIKK